MSFTSVNTHDLDDEEFGRQLALICAFWTGLFLVATWLLLNYGHVATSILF